MVLAWEQWLALQHLSEYTSCTPDVHFHVIFLPCEHDLRRSVVPRRYVAGHLWVLYTSKTEVTNLQVAVFVHQDVAGLQVAVDDARRVNVFQTSLLPLAQRNGSRVETRSHQYLVEEVLNELLLKGAGGEETVEVCA